MAIDMTPRDEMALVDDWTKHIAAYEKVAKEWWPRVRKILERYTDKHRNRTVSSPTQFNILWSNVETLKAATFARLPKADVSRRFSDTDPVGRVASMILERALQYEIEHYPDYFASMSQCVQDRFLGGRGVAWARYEPHMRAMETGGPVDGAQVTEDIDTPGEELDYECAPTDYVHWRDFGHSVARTWEEVSRVWRWVYMDRPALVERFGEELGAKIPLDSSPEEMKRARAASPDGLEGNLAKVLEGWDKTNKTAVWISTSMGKVLDIQDDPMGFEEFFPCPKPLYATLTSESLIPVPDFVYYQDQANELDILSDRIDGLIKALKLRGVYDASIPELARLFTEGENNTLIPVKNWQAFAEKAGLKGALDVVDILPLAQALREAYQAFEQVKQQVYELTSIADIIRGQTDANETLGAQQLKSQYASLRLKVYQDAVARFASDLIRLKAQVICGKFQPQTILQMAAVDQLTPDDQQLVMPAMQLLLGDRVMNPAATGKNPMRSFRIEVSSDSMVNLDEQAEKESRVEFLTAVGTFLERAAQVGTVVPTIIPLLMEMLKFGVTGFKAGRQLEGVIDQSVEQLKQMAQQPPPEQPNPEAGKAEAAMISAQVGRETEEMRLVGKREEIASRAELEREKMVAQTMLERERLQAQAELEREKMAAAQAFDSAQKDADRALQITLARMSSQDKAIARQASGAPEVTEEERTIAEMREELLEARAAIDQLMQSLARPRIAEVIERDQGGRIAKTRTYTEDQTS